MKALPVLALGMLLAGCASTPDYNVRKSGDRELPLGEAAYDEAPDAAEIPPDVASIPDAEPKDEPLARSGNAPEYEVFGEKYSVLPSARDFRQKGRASWYGKRFHGRKTASGERYDMFGMSAAHKTLPLPTYVRVTNLKNGRSVIVRVNDRGPFHPDRVIDLSYAAAAKLGFIEQGHAPVELEAVVPGKKEPRPAPERGWLQVAAYTDPINAVAVREQLGEVLGAKLVDIKAGGTESEPLHRVVVGPFENPTAAKLVHDDLHSRGYVSSWVTD